MYVGNSLYTVNFINSLKKSVLTALLMNKYNKITFMHILIQLEHLVHSLFTHFLSYFFFIIDEFVVKGE
jgi:hypothetical protein